MNFVFFLLLLDDVVGIARLTRWGCQTIAHASITNNNTDRGYILVLRPHNPFDALGEPFTWKRLCDIHGNAYVTYMKRTLDLLFIKQRGKNSLLV